MIQHTTSTSIFPGAARPLPRRALSPTVIPSEARTASSPRAFAICHSERSEPRPRHAPSQSVISSEARNLSYGLSGGFSAGGADFADGVVGFAGASFPTVKYLRIFSSRFGPSPRIASKSSTLLNAPYDFLICNILSAVAGPMPGTCCNSSDVAVLRFTGFAGGFFLANAPVPNRRHRMRGMRIANDRHAMADV